MTSWENVARVGLSSSDPDHETFQVLHLRLKAISVSDSYILCSLMLSFLMVPPVLVIRRGLGVEDGVLFKLLDSLRINLEFLAVQGRACLDMVRLLRCVLGAEPPKSRSRIQTTPPTSRVSSSHPLLWVN